MEEKGVIPWFIFHPSDWIWSEAVIHRLFYAGALTFWQGLTDCIWLVVSVFEFVVKICQRLKRERERERNRLHPRALLADCKPRASPPVLSIYERPIMQIKIGWWKFQTWWPFGSLQKNNVLVQSLCTLSWGWWNAQQKA